MKLKRIRGKALALAVAFLLYATSCPALGMETDFLASLEEEAIPISTVEELRALDGKDGQYYLTQDIVLTGEWTPIEFHGSLDGQGHAICGLRISSLRENLFHYGLFSDLSSNYNAVGNYNRTFSHQDYMERERIHIRNITLKDAKITLSLSNDDDYYIGVLCGYASNVTFENCLVTGSVDITCDSTSQINWTYNRIAGMCGNCSSAGYVRFFDCKSHCEVTGTGVDTVCGMCAGYPEVMANCRNSGAITSYQGRTVGGIVNYANTIFDCENSGDVCAFWKSEEMVTTGNNSMYVGGVMGGSNGFRSLLACCRNTGAVTVLRDSVARHCHVYAGGIASILSSDGAGMSRCENTGDVYVSTHTKGVSYACETTAGGLVGKANMDSFHNAGFSQTYIDCSNSGNVIACAVSCRPDARAGGICGDVFVNGGHTVSFENCLSTGHVKATDMGSDNQCKEWKVSLENEYAYGGGIVGHTVSSLVDDNCDLVIRNCAAVCPDVESVLDYGSEGESIASWIAPYGIREGNVAVFREEPDAKYEDDESLKVLQENKMRSISTYKDMGWDIQNVWFQAEEGEYPILYLKRQPGEITMTPTAETMETSGNSLSVTVRLYNTTGREVRGGHPRGGV